MSITNIDSEPYAYEESDGENTQLVYAIWFNSPRRNRNSNKTYEPLYRALKQPLVPPSEGRSATGGEVRNGN